MCSSDLSRRAKRDLAIALGSVLILPTALRGGQERSTPEPGAEVKGVVLDVTGAVIPQFPRRPRRCQTWKCIVSLSAEY